MTPSITGATLAALLAAVLAATAHCAPSGGARGTTSGLSAHPPWHNPCGVQGKSAHRHSRKNDPLQEALDDILLQFKTTQGGLKQLRPSINKLYKDVSKFKSQPISWLTFKHFEWYKKELRELPLKEKTARVLAEMHTGLQKMLATVVSVQRLEHFGEQLEPRRKIFAEVRIEVNKMLCEAEAALLSLNASLPELVSDDDISWETHDKATDTQLLVDDWRVLDTLTRSVKQWLRVLKDLRRKPRRANSGNAAAARGNSGNAAAARVNKGKGARNPRKRRGKQPARH
ncbi:uncharacterized protein LOC134530417 [Bacillus rossius redtenbacheri]|uniref:uncharacterized protein LOC134530417 n=1 Tax=Bacillus rossius redtenbacheri TaxID=93214 RepID=UPI002FDCA3D0